MSSKAGGALAVGRGVDSNYGNSGFQNRLGKQEFLDKFYTPGDQDVPGLLKVTAVTPRGSNRGSVAFRDSHAKLFARGEL